MNVQQKIYPVVALPVSSISLQVNETALRTVDKNSKRYLEILESAKYVDEKGNTRGITTPILVRVEKNPETGKDQHILVDGDHRLKVAQDLGFETIQAQVRDDISAIDGLAIQIVNNYQRVETKKCKLAEGILRILSERQDLTLADMSRTVGIDPKELEKILTLTKLKEEVQTMVDNSVVPLAVAYALAKLPEDQQLETAETLLTGGESVREQVESVNVKIKENRDAARQGKAVSKEEKVFAPVAHARKFAELKEASEAPEVLEQILTGVSIKNKVDAAKAVILWTLHLDPVSVAEQEALFNKQKELDEEKKRLKEMEKLRVQRERAKAAQLKSEQQLQELETVAKG